jgi:hypothetical protein
VLAHRRADRRERRLEDGGGVKRLSVHAFGNASDAYRANLAEAQHIAAALLQRLQNMAGDVDPKDWPAAGSIAALRIKLEEATNGR